MFGLRDSKEVTTIIVTGVVLTPIIIGFSALYISYYISTLVVGAALNKAKDVISGK